MVLLLYLHLTFSLNSYARYRYINTDGLLRLVKSALVMFLFVCLYFILLVVVESVLLLAKIRLFTTMFYDSEVFFYDFLLVSFLYFLLFILISFSNFSLNTTQICLRLADNRQKSHTNYRKIMFYLEFLQNCEKTSHFQRWNHRIACEQLSSRNDQQYQSV